MVEAKAWQSLQDGAEREIRQRQNAKLMEQEKVETIKVVLFAYHLTSQLGERKILANRATEMIEEKLDKIREQDTIFEKAKEENEILYREEREAKDKRYQEIRDYEQEHLKSMVARDPFKSKIATMSLTNAKKLEMSKKQNFGTATKQEIVLPPSKYDDDKPMKVTFVEPVNVSP